jgi:hypothetical protein
MKASEFLTRYGITGEVNFVTDFTEETDHGRIPRRRFTATFVHKGNTLEVPDYSTGAWGAGPDLADVLHLVGQDAQVGSLGFDEYLDEFGIEDIERQRETWRNCRESSRRAYAWVSSEAMWDNLRTVEEG